MADEITTGKPTTGQDNDTINDSSTIKYWITDTQLQMLADAIRAEGNTSALLTYPNGFVSAINNLSGVHTDNIPANWPKDFNNIYWTTNEELQSIADAIRIKTNTSETLTYLEDFINNLTIVNENMWTISPFYMESYDSTTGLYTFVAHDADSNVFTTSDNTMFNAIYNSDYLNIKFNEDNVYTLTPLSRVNLDITFGDTPYENTSGILFRLTMIDDNIFNIKLQYCLENVTWLRQPHPSLSTWDQQKIIISQNIYY